MPDDMQTGGQVSSGAQGQAPNAAQQHSQHSQNQQLQSQAGDAAQQPSSQSTPQAGADPVASPNRDSLSVEDLREALRKAREEAAAHRVKLREYEDAHKAAELAKLDETERLRRQLADLQSQQAAATIQAQERIVRAEVKAAASAVGIKPALAARLIDFASIEYDSESGEPTNISLLLTKLAEDYPELKAAQAAPPQQTPRASAGAPASPPRSSTQASGGLTREMIERMTPREYAQRRAEVMAWLAANPNR